MPSIKNDTLKKTNIFTFKIEMCHHFYRFLTFGSSKTMSHRYKYIFNKFAWSFLCLWWKKIIKKLPSEAHTIKYYYIISYAWVIQILFSVLHNLRVTDYMYYKNTKYTFFFFSDNKKNSANVICSRRWCYSSVSTYSRWNVK